MKNFIITLSLSILAVACNRDSVSDSVEMTMTETSYSLPRVETVEAKSSVFNHEILANGIIVCSNYVDAYFSTTDIITKMNVRNGEFVRGGEVIATVDGYQADMNIQQAKIALAQSELELQDALIGQGYDPTDKNKVPSEIMTLLELRSGVTAAKTNLEKAEREKRNTKIISPFDGVVANVSQMQGNKSDPSRPFCRILSSGDMAVEFKIIEQELPLININDKVELHTIGAGMQMNAVITEINPIIGDDGQILVRAKVSNPRKLTVGQHVKIAVKREISKTIVLPKNAVVMRDQRPVVFSVASDSTAQWNYVDVVYENLTEYAVDGIDEGTEVIISGNKNLSHGSRVTKK